MSYRVEVKRSALKDMAAMRPELAQAARARIDALADDPRPSGCKPLKGRKRGLWRVRVGEYRVVYAVDDEARTVTVAGVLLRSRAYD